MRIALIGPPFSGKTTLFEAVAAAAGSHVDVSRSDQPHLAVVKVPDPRLDWLVELYKPKKVAPAELEFLDLPGFDLRDDAGRNASRAYWAAMRQADMIVMVVRGFEDASTPAYRDRVDPVADAEELQTEMLFADLDQVTGRIERLEAQLRKPANRDATQKELALMQRLAEALENDQPIRSAVQNEAEAKAIRSFAFLSLKPQLVVVNCGEEAAGEPGPEQIAGVDAMQCSAKIEKEIAELDEPERQEFLAELGIEQPARDRLIRACYRKLELISMFTVGEDECKAWTLPAGADAVAAAGEIHSDIARGFIRAETMAYDDLVEAKGDPKGVKAAGKLRLEGKTYPVADGDIINFRFNV